MSLTAPPADQKADAASPVRAFDLGGFRFIAQVLGDSESETAPLNWIERAEWQSSSQAETIYRRLAEAMDASGGLDGMCRQHIYQRDKRFYPVFERVRLAQ